MDWLTMVYLGADNDLFRFGNTLLDELQRFGSTDRVTIVAQRDPTNVEEPSVRGLVRRGRWEKQTIGVTANDALAIVDFANWAATQYPAARKMLVMWDHGNGWQNVHAFEPVASVPDQLQTVALGEALEALDGGTVDVLCFDACLNAMIEIAYQLRNRVKYMVASENVVRADTGWPYSGILGMLNTRPHMEPDEAARGIVGAFAGSYNDSKDPITLSALDLSKVEDVTQKIAELSRLLIAACRNGGREKVLLARRLCQSFGNPDYIDLISFCGELEAQVPDTAAAKAAAAVRQAATELVIAASRGSAASIRGANGVSIYFPDRPLSPQYELLEFPHRSGWSGFLRMVVPQEQPPEVLRFTRAAVVAEAEPSRRGRPAKSPKPKGLRRHAHG